MIALARANLRRALRLGVAQLVLALLALLFVRREVWQLQPGALALNQWQEGVLILLAAIDGAIAGAFQPFAERNALLFKSHRRLLSWGIPTFFFLYVSCAALCERLSVTVLPATLDTVRDLGLVLVVLGIVFSLRAKTSATSIGPDNDGEQPTNIAPYALIRYPDALGKLISLLGLPLVFNCWMPLLILPGVFVLMKWQITDYESLHLSEGGQNDVDSHKRSWKLIPFIY